MAEIFKRVEGRPEQGEVIVLHGLGSHSGLYDHVISPFVEQGYRVHTFDYPGHGRSSGKRGHATVDEILEILHSTVKDIGKPVYIYGKSLGGLVALRYAQEHPENVLGLVLESPSITISGRSPLKSLIGKIGARLLRSITVSTGIRPKDLSRNPDVVKKHENDQYFHDRISLALFSSMLQHMAKARVNIHRTITPMLILLGGRDHLINRKAAMDIFSKAPAAEIHIFPMAGHDVLNDPDHGRRVKEELLRWVLRLSRAPREGSE